MSSGFVSGGTADAPIERDDEWRKAQLEIDEKRRQKEELGKQNEGKSLFEVLQANCMSLSMMMRPSTWKAFWRRKLEKKQR